MFLEYVLTGIIKLCLLCDPFLNINLYYGIVNHVQFYTLQFSNPFLLLPRSASTQMLMLSWNHPKQSCTWRCRTLLLKLTSHRYWSLSSASTQFFWEFITQTTFYAMLSVISVLSVVKFGLLNTISCSTCLWWSCWSQSIAWWKMLPTGSSDQMSL